MSVGRERRGTQGVGLRVRTFNVGTMTEKGSELVDGTQRRKVDRLCPGDQLER